MNYLFFHTETNTNIRKNDEIKKCNFCEKTKTNVRLQTLDLKKYVPVCDDCYSTIIFPQNFEKKENQTQNIKKL
jgi:hypothetical protein